MYPVGFWYWHTGMSAQTLAPKKIKNKKAVTGY